MADYWVSQAKKYCDFCKCWISDNKPSIQFHENGKKHKENVARRLNEISKKSAKDAKEALNVDNEMKKMEEAAMKAYMKDIEANADYSSQVINKELAERSSPSLASSTKVETKKSDKVVQEKKPAPKIKKWYEAVSDQGYTYYWNVDTGESVWEPPGEGYLSLKEQEELKKKKEGKVKKEEKTDSVADKNKEIYKVKTEVKEEPLKAFGPAPKSDPYGKWEKVVEEKFKPLDLGLLERDHMPRPVANIYKEPERKFKEKTLPTAGSLFSGGGDIGFKKRKFSSQANRNTRQRLDDD